MIELIQATNVYYSTVEGFVTGDPLLLNLRRMAGHITREHDMYDIGSVLERKNGDACVDSLMNGHWEELLLGKVEELPHATHDPGSYRMLIQQIFPYTSDGEQRLKSFLRSHMIKCVQGAIEAMSSLGASGCASALVDLHQQLTSINNWQTGHGGYSGGWVLQLLTKHLRKSCRIILICAMQSKPK